MRARPLAVSVARVRREIELRRHTDADGDVLTTEGVAAALEIGARLRGGYQLAVSTGAQRATQTLACFLAALGQQVPGGVMVEPGLRSQVEDRWRAAYQEAGSGALAAPREADPELVADDSAPATIATRSNRSTSSETRGSCQLCGRDQDQEFAEPVALSSAQPADRPLPRRALRWGLNLVVGARRGD